MSLPKLAHKYNVETSTQKCKRIIYYEYLSHLLHVRRESTRRRHSLKSKCVAKLWLFFRISFYGIHISKIHPGQWATGGNQLINLHTVLAVGTINSIDIDIFHRQSCWSVCVWEAFIDIWGHAVLC